MERDFCLNEQDTSYVFARFGIYYDETDAFRDPQHQIRDSDVAKRLSVIQPGAGISFDEFGHEHMICGPWSLR
jgi:hypothetical protein